MALLSGIGTEDAESYVSVAFADAYHVSRGNTAWAGVIEADKETALRRATVWLDARYRNRYPGVRLRGREQALEWPRHNAWDVSGWPISSKIVPVEVQFALCEAALREVGSPGSLSPDVVLSDVKVLTQVGELEWTPLAGTSGASAVTPIVAVIDDVMSSIVRSGNRGIVRA